jgi:hypothetical protein
MGAVWLGCPSLGAWLGFSVAHMCIHHYKTKLSYMHSKMGGIYTYILNHTDCTIGKDRSDLLFLTVRDGSQENVMNTCGILLFRGMVNHPK